MSLLHAVRRRNRHILNHRPELRRLRAQLLDIAGRDVFFEPTEAYPDALLQRSRAFGPTHRLEPGLPQECHHNTARLHQREPTLRICTGYALADDGLWYRHSWLLTPHDEPVETTTPRRLYYGAVLTPDETRGFLRAEGEHPHG